MPGWCQSGRGRINPPGDYGDPCGRPPAAGWAGDADCRQSPAAAEELLLLLQVFLLPLQAGQSGS